MQALTLKPPKPLTPRPKLYLLSGHGGFWPHRPLLRLPTLRRLAEGDFQTKPYIKKGSGHSYNYSILNSNLKYSIMYPKQTKTTLLSPLNCRCCAGHRDFRQGPHRLVHAALHGRSHSEAFNGLRVSGLWVKGLRVWGPGFRVLDLGCLGFRGGSLEFSFSGSLNMKSRALGVVRFPGLVQM